MMNFTIQLHHVEPFMTLDLPKKIGLSIMIFLTLSLGIIVQKQLISFLKYKKKRPVNQIIYTNLILSNTFVPPNLCFILAMTQNLYPGRYMGEFVCYGFFSIGAFIVYHDRSRSLFLNIFRYLCIVKEKTLRTNEVLPKVSNNTHQNNILALKKIDVWRSFLTFTILQ